MNGKFQRATDCQCVIVKLSARKSVRLQRRHPRRMSRLLASLLLLLAPPAALALPTGGQPVAGSVVIAKPSAQTMTIDQSTAKAIVNWQGFGIARGESVVISQPGASSVLLNRVVGGDLSAIYGRLSATGQVFLVNPMGVMFAPGAQVDVQGLVASTLGITDADFLAGRYVFTNPGNAGAVLNQGTINAGSLAALLGPQVRNDGVINARMGTVGLAAGDRVSVDFRGDGLVSFSVDRAAVGALARNSGLIAAEGGNVQMTAQAANALLDTVINMDGVVRATSLSARNGRIVLDGGPSGVVSVSGTLDASGRGAGQTGGSVHVLGDKVGLFGTANVDASGDRGGGTVLVGGNWQGQGPERNASATFFGPSATIAADALTSGNGGTVVLWADGVTKAAGAIGARGGAQSGNGGSVEVSGKEVLEFQARVNTSAPNGRLGLLLLDPGHIEVCAAGGGCATGNITESPTSTWTANNDTAKLTWESLEPGNAAANLVVNTSGTGKNISITSGPASFSQNGSTTFNATGNISISSGANINNTGSGDLIFNAGASGTVTVNANVTTTGGAITLNGAGGVLLGGDLSNTNGAGAITLTGPTTLKATNVSISSGAGQVEFQAALNGESGQTRNLNVTAGGNVIFGGVVGTTNALTSYTQSGGAALVNGGTFTTSGNQNFAGELRLGVDTVLNAGAGSIALATVTSHSSTARALTITASGAKDFNGDIGAENALASLTSNGGGTTRVQNTATITTTGTQTYSNALLLNAGGVFVSTGSGNLTFTGAVDGPGALTANTAGTTTFASTVGNTNRLASITTNSGGTTALNGGTFRTAGTMSFGDNVTLGAGTTLDSSGVGAAGNISFGGTVNNGQTLAISTAGATTFSQAVGGSTPLTSFTKTGTGATAINGGTFTTSGTQSFSDAVTVADGATTIAGSALTFGSTLNAGATNTNTLALRADALTFSGGGTPVSGGGTLALEPSAVGGSIGVAGGAGALQITQVGHLDKLADGFAAVRIGRADGTGTTTINAVSLKDPTTFLQQNGTLTVAGTITSTDNASVLLNAGTLGSSRINLNGDVDTSAAGAGTPVTFTGPVTLGGGARAISSGAGAVTFGQTVNGSQALTVTSSGTTTFGGAVGDSTAVTSLTLADAAGTTAINGGTITTSGTQSYAGSVTVGGPTTLSGSALTFGSTLAAGANTLTLRTNAPTFSGAADSVTGSGTMRFETANAGDSISVGVGGGTLQIDPTNHLDKLATGFASVVIGRSDGTGGINVGALALKHPTTFQQGSGDITFGAAVEGPGALVANTSGTTTFSDTVGSGTRLASITTNSGGTTALNGGTFRTSGTMSFGDNVTLGAGTTLDSSGAGAAGNISFGGTVNNGQTLAINTAGTTTFNDRVGNSTPLASLTVAGGGSTSFNVTPPGNIFFGGTNTASVQTSGNQSYGPISLQQDTYLYSSTGTITRGTITLNGHAFYMTEGGGGGCDSLIGTIGSGGTFSNCVNLLGNLTLNAGSSDVTFAAAVDGGFGLTINSTGTTTFGGVVGGNAALASLTTNSGGATAMNGGTFSTSAAMSFGDNVTLGANTTLNAGSVTFSGTVNSDGTPGGRALAIDAAGTTTFSQAVGSTAALASFTKTGTGTTAINGGTSTTTGGQSYAGAVTIGGGATTLRGSSLQFDSTLAAGANALTLQSNALTFNGAVNSVSGTGTLSIEPLNAGDSIGINGGAGTLQVTQAGHLDKLADGFAALNIGRADGTGTTTFGGSISLEDPTTFRQGNGGTLSLPSSLAIQGAGNASLAFDAGSVGAIQIGSLASVTVQTSNQNISFTGAVSLSSPSTVFVQAGTGNVAFNQSIDGGGSVLVTGTTGTTTFSGTIGNSQPLSSLSVSGPTTLNIATASDPFYTDVATVRTTGNQTFTGALTLTGGSVMLTSTGGNITFPSVSGVGTRAIYVRQNGVSCTETQGVATGGGTASGCVALVGSYTVNAGASDVTYPFAIDGNHALTINSTGTVSFGSAVGASTPLASLTTNAGGATRIQGGLIRTSGAQTYNDTVELLNLPTALVGGTFDLTSSGTINGNSNDLTLTFSGLATINGASVSNVANLLSNGAGTTALGGTITTTGFQSYLTPVTLVADTTLVGTTGAFTGGVAGGNHDLALNFSGLTTINGGSFTGVRNFSVGNGGTTSLSGTLTTTGTQTYGDSVDLAGATLLTSGGAGAAGDIAFNGTVDGGNTLRVETAGTTTFGAAVGSGTRVTSVHVTGATASNTTDIRTTGTQTYTGALTLGGAGAGSTFDSNGAGAIAFGSTIDGAKALATNTGGTTTFGGAVGNGTRLTSVAVTGATASNTTDIKTTGSQTYTGPLTLGGAGAGTTFDSNGAGAIAFGSTVDGGKALGTNTTGTTTFGGAVGGGTRLTSVTTTGPVSANAADVRTTGAQSFGGALTLGTGVTFDSDGGGNVSFAGTVNGPQTLTVNTTGTTTFGGMVGGNAPLVSLTTNAGGSTVVSGGGVTTIGAQSYGDTLQLGANGTFTGASGTFTGAIQGGGFDLALNFTGNTVITGSTFTNVNNFSTGGGGSSDVSGTIATTGTQTYNDAVSLTGATTLQTAGGAAVTFGSSVDGTQTLTVSSSGTTTFNAAVGGVLPLAALTTAGGAAINGGTVSTTGGQSFSGAVTLGANATLASTGSGNVSFGSTVNGPGALTVNTGGTTTLTGTVGGTSPLAGLQTDAVGNTVLNASAVTTTGDLRFLDPVVSGAGGVALAAGSGAISIANTANNLQGPVAVTGGATEVRTTGALRISGAVGSLAATAAGDVTQPGGALLVSGATTIDGGSGGNLTLQNASNQFGGSVTLTGNQIKLTSSTPLALGSISSHSSLTGQSYDYLLGLPLPTDAQQPTVIEQNTAVSRAAVSLTSTGAITSTGGSLTFDAASNPNRSVHLEAGSGDVGSATRPLAIAPAGGNFADRIVVLYKVDPGQKVIMTGPLVQDNVDVLKPKPYSLTLNETDTEKFIYNENVVRSGVIQTIAGETVGSIVSQITDQVESSFKPGAIDQVILFGFQGDLTIPVTAPFGSSGGILLPAIGPDENTLKKRSP